MSFPLPPSSALDWENLGLSGVEGISHVESRYSTKTGQWSEPEIVQDPWIRVHGLSPALNYGQQCYEGMKAVRQSPTKIAIFNPHRHAARMRHSCAVVSIPEIPESIYLTSTNLAVAANSQFVPPHNSKSIMYIRPLVFGSSASIAPAPPEEYIFAVFVQPGKPFGGTQALPAVIMDDFDRAAPLGVGHAKVGGNYAPAMRHNAAARREGYAMTLHLDALTHSFVEEFSSSAFLGVKRVGDKVTVVSPKSAAALESITGASLQQLATSLGYEVQVREIAYEELSSFDEILSAGTGTSMLPIRSITRPSTGDKFEYQNGSAEMGPVGRELSTKMDDIVKGRTTDPFGWCVPVYDPAPKEDDVMVTAVNDLQAGIPVAVP